MTKQISSLILLAFLLLFTGCSKDDKEPEPQIIPTSLQLTILDEIGNPVAGATVKLHSSEMGMLLGMEQVGETQTSNEAGKVTFSGLEATTYYWSVEKDCHNNMHGAMTTSSPLIANQANTFNVVLTATGTLEFSNYSENSYSITVDNQYVGDVEGYAEGYLYFVPEGTHTVKVTQLEGYVFSPTEKTFSVNVTCGQTTAVSFP